MPSFTPLNTNATGPALQTTPITFGQSVTAPKVTAPAAPAPVKATTPVATAPTNPATPAQDPVQPPKPITAFSSDQGATAAAENTQKLQTLKNTGLTLGPDGLARFSDMSFATAPSDATQNEDGTWQSGGVKYAIGPATSMDPELQKMNDMINNMKSQFDATSRAAIDNIKAQFENLIRQQTDINTRQTASLDQSLLMAGSSRYAQQSSEGQHAAIMSYGLGQISDLTSKEQSAVIQAQQAMDAGDMKLMDSSLSLAQNARDAKQKAAADLSKKLTDANDALQAQKKAAQQDSAIGSLLSQGVTDNAEILKQLNAAGYNMTAKDIADSIKNLSPDAAAVHTIMSDVAKNGATPAVLKAIGASRDVASAIRAAGSFMIDPSSAVGQYQAYMQQATAKGQTPVSYQTWNDKHTAAQEYNKAYNAKAGANAADAAYNKTSTGQDKLEQEYRAVLLKEVSNRSGDLGIQNGKVSQAIHLKNIFDQYKDSNGNFNIPAAQYSEVAQGLATLISNNNTISDARLEGILTKTAAGDLKGAITYITGSPQNGTTQAVLKNLYDSIERQGKVAEDVRDKNVEFLHGLAPTGLAPERIKSLEKQELPSFRNPPVNQNDQIMKDETAAEATIGTFYKSSPENKALIDDIHAQFPSMSAQEVAQKLGLK